jgi:hypothetical protein
LSGLLRQPGDEELGVLPADIDHWAVAASPAVIVGTRLASASIGALIPLRKRHLAAADGEGLANADRMLGLLIGRLIGSHHEIPWRHHHKLRTIIAIAK